MNKYRNEKRIYFYKIYIVIIYNTLKYFVLYLMNEKE